MPPFHEAMHRLLHEHHHDEPPVVEPPADDLTGDGAVMLYIGCALALLSSLSQVCPPCARARLALTAARLRRTPHPGRPLARGADRQGAAEAGRQRFA